MTITIETTVGQIATEFPLATRVFGRHKMDFCCGGGVAIGDVCREQGLDPEQILSEIHHELDNSQDDVKRWDESPLDELIEHILSVYHAPLEEELNRLEFMARKVLNVHGSKEPIMLPELLNVFLSLKAELLPHMQKEEQILFPMITQGQGAMAGGPVSVLQNEHDSAGVALKNIRALTRDFELHPEACNTWRALWHGLAALESDLNQHIHLENNILFPRALAS